MRTENCKFLKLIIKQLIVLFVLISSLHAYAQYEDQLIQFSGMVISEDSLKSLPYTHVINKTQNQSAMTNPTGFFSCVVEKGDSIIFSRIGYRSALFIIPLDNDSLNIYNNKSELSIVQTLKSDTILLPVAVIYPWLNKMFFKEAFIKTIIPMDDYERAKHNLALILSDVGYDVLPMDGMENQKYYLQSEAGKWYTAGQYPTINLLNPMAWAKFIQAFRNGDFKRK
ncbi:MAG: hypothetical protein JKY33_09240 [Bacteroidia bacterium]|nr:hypothetical protein [Bacteroidia bacterium]